MAEFEDPTALVAATERAHEAGYRRMDAYSPFPIEELHDAIGSPHTRLPLIVLIGGIVGCLGGYFLQYWASAMAYPINVGGKPLNSWPAFIPVTFECTILVAALAAVLGHAGAQRAADAVSPGLQRRRDSRWPAATGSSVHRSARPEVQISKRHAASSRRSARGR